MIKKLFYLKPNLATNRRFKQYVVIFNHFAHHWNELAHEHNFLVGHNGKKLPYLKRQHQEAFFTLIRYYSVQIGKIPMRRNNKGYEASELPPLQMNNVKLANALKCSTTTAWRYLNTLAEAGIIKEKIFHGTTADYELVFHEDFILMYDEANHEIKPDSAYLHPLTENDKISICKPYWKLSSSIKKKINSVETVEKSEKTDLKGVLRTRFKNPYKIPPEIDEKWIKHPKNIDDNSADQQEKTENSAPNDPKNPRNAKLPDSSARNKEHRDFQSHVLFLYAVNLLWPGGKLWVDEKGKMRYISEAEQRRTEEYISENFWTQCKTPEDMDKWREYYEKGIRRAKEWLDNQRFDNYYVNPYKYFSRNYEKGFFQAYHWAKRQFEADKAKERRRKYNKTLRRAIAAYMKNPNPKEVIRINNKLKRIQIPVAYIERFNQAVENNVRNNNNKNTLEDQIPNNFKAMIYDQQAAS